MYLTPERSQIDTNETPPGGKTNNLKEEKIMKKIIISISIVLISLSVYTQAGPHTAFFSGSHDSLLFDGDDANSINILKPAYDRCKIIVKNVKGTVTGTYLVEKNYYTCGEKGADTIEEKGQIKSDLYDLVPGDGIKTGKDGLALLQLSDGTVIALHNNTSIILPKDYCKHNFNPIELKEGIIKVVKTGDKGADIGTSRSKTKNKKTQFSVEIVQDGDVTTDIVKVYEGSVEVQNELQTKEYQKNTKDKGPEMTQLTKDYQSGKISIEEFSKKMSELQKEITMPQNPVTVNAGFQSRIAGLENPTEPEPFDTNENNWWEEK